MRKNPILPFLGLILLAAASCKRNNPAAPQALLPSPTRTPSTPSASPTVSASPTISATVSDTATGTPTASPTRTPSPSSTASPTATPSFTSSPTSTPTPTRTATATSTNTPTPVMIDDFEDSDLNTLQSLPWQGYDDSSGGGSSTVLLSNLAGGAAATARSLRMNGTLTANVGCGAGCYYGYSQGWAWLNGISPSVFHRVRMYLKGGVPSAGFAASGLALSIYMPDGDYFTLDMTPSLTGSWTQGSFDLSAASPDTTNIHSSFTMETADISALILYPIAYSLSPGTSGAYSVDVDQLEVY